MSRFIEKMLEHEIDAVNDHLPTKRVALIDMIDAETPNYETRSGEMSVFRKEEIVELARKVPKQYHESFMIPIIFIRRMDIGRGVYSITGSKPELFFIHHVLGYVDLEWSEMSSWKSVDKLARPQIQLLRRKFPSVTCVGVATITDTS
ncbi:MAG: DUF61 family protein [Candidatus Thorarchaeota archaeon]